MPAARVRTRDAGHRLNLLSPSAQPWVEPVLATPVVLWGAWPFFVRFVQSVVNRSPNMWTLIAPFVILDQDQYSGRTDAAK